MRKNLYFSLLTLLISFQYLGQFNFEHSPHLTVIKTNDTLDLAWAGGLNYAQFSEIDFDFDGDMDLFVFDRSSNNIRLFRQELENGVRKYILDFKTPSLFPSDLKYRATTVDYDQDGRNDLFCYGIGGMKVYRNVGDSINGIQWIVAKELLYSDYNGTVMNLYVSSTDIPALVDVEQDGDLDILTYSISGQHLEYHQNQSMEQYGVPDSLEFVLKNQCWGLFSEDMNTNSMILNDQSLPCTQGNVVGAESPTHDPENSCNKKPILETKHSGSTVLALDIDSSGVLDLLVGDVAYPNLILLTNGGTEPNTNSAMISVEDAFPSNSLPANLELFPAPFFLDVDFDNRKDLIVCANAKNISENERSILYYHNSGSNLHPIFVYQTNDFLQHEMIEHGTGSIPVFADINQDGLQDLFVANLFRYKPILSKESSVAYYQNTGTAVNPEFTFIDDDFLNLSSQSLGLRMVPTFGDLDHDDDADLIVGLEDGTIRYFVNNSNGSTPVFSQQQVALTDDLGNTISSGQFASPQLFDLNDDGLLDLIIGKKTGELAYYQNVGSITSPIFKLINDSLGSIDIASSTPDGYATPHFFRYHDTVFLFLGGIDGQLHFYTDIADHLLPGNSFQLVSDQFLGLQTGAYSSFWVNDIDQDSRLNLFVGHDLGGLFHLEHDPNSSALVSENSTPIKISIYPNPTMGNLYISSEETETISFQIFDVFGKSVLENKLSNGKINIDLNWLNRGVYMILFEDNNGKRLIKKLIFN